MDKTPERKVIENGSEVRVPRSSYFCREIAKLDFGEGYWNHIEVGVFEKKPDGTEVQIGSYTRNYHCLYKTFVPFQKDGKWYALYSKDYTSTRVMSLPDCKDLGGESPHGFGFCPVDYDVPQAWELEGEYDGRVMTHYKKVGEDFIDDPDCMKELGSFGFIAGCVWGDDSSWKIQWLDLSRIEEGIIKREEKFGYIELPKDMDLKDAIKGVYIWHPGCIQVDLGIKITYRIEGDKLTTFGKDEIADSTKKEPTKKQEVQKGNFWNQFLKAFGRK
jgi:hypothetical protein